MTEPQTGEKVMPGSGTIYTVAHPRAFTPQSYVMLDKTADEVARKGPTLLDLLGDEKNGKTFLRDIFRTVAAARTASDGAKQDFIAVIHSTTSDTNPNRVSVQLYFHGHIAVGGRDDKFIKAASESQSYWQKGPDAKLVDAINRHALEGIAGKVSGDGLTELFEPAAEHRHAGFHRFITVNAGDLEQTAESDQAVAAIRKMLLDNIVEPSGRTGVRLVIDTINHPDSNGRTGLVIHMLGDLDEDIVTDAKSGKPAQRRWFEIPKP